MKRKDVLDLPQISLYRFENFLNVYQDKNNFYFYNLLKSINIFKSDNDQVEDTYVIKHHDSWTGISFKYYQTIDLWWLICTYNQIQNPLKMPDPGSPIKILKPEYIGKILNEINSQISK